MTQAVVNEANVVPRHVDVAVVGSGFSGLAVAIRLDRAGHRDFLVLERGADVGGTWRDNTYPGAACDVPSHLYSYSFALNPDWTRSFSKQSEIENYLRGVAADAAVLDRHRFGVTVERATWDGDRGLWELRTTRGDLTARVLVGAFGALAEPSLPDIPGIDEFDGQLFHSAQWNHDASLRGKRVAVIGTGASAIQIVPAIVDDVEHLDVYQRTAPWLLPRFDRPFTRFERWLFHRVPTLLRLARAGIYAAREVQVLGLAKRKIFMKPLELISRFKILREIRDPQLRRRVTPNFQIGCKRMLITNDWYRALDQRHVELVTDRIASVDRDVVVSQDGTRRPVDAIVVATGFRVTDSPMFDNVVGLDGKSLRDAFDEAGMRAYKGTTVSGFPNLFILVGPNTGLGHTSMIFMIESQVNYVVDAIGKMRQSGLSQVSVRQEAVEEYNRRLQQKMAGTVWMTGGCASWYLDAHGNNTTLWPDFTFRFRRITKSFDLDAYDAVSGATDDVPEAPAVQDRTA